MNTSTEIPTYDTSTHINAAKYPSPESIIFVFDAMQTKVPKNESAGPHSTFVSVTHNMTLLRIPSYLYAICSIYMAIMLTRSHLIKARNCKVRKNEDKNPLGQTLEISRVFAAYFSACYFTYSSFSFLIEGLDNIDCNWFGKSENALYWLNISVIYVVLWFRQRAIYGKPTLKHLTTKMTSSLSNAAGVMVLALPIVNSALFSAALIFEKRDGICSPAGSHIPQTILITSEFVVTIFLPLTLLSLFVWPLIRHHMSTGLDSRGQNSVIPAIRKITLLTAGCLVTDMVAMTCNFTLDILYSYIGRQTSVFTNLLFLNFAFSDWKAVMAPCARMNKLKGENRLVRLSWTQAANHVWSTTDDQDNSGEDSSEEMANVRLYRHDQYVNGYL